MTLALIASAASGIVTPAWSADCHYEAQSYFVNGVEHTHLVEVCEDVPAGGATVPVDQPPTNLGWDALCVTTAMDNGVDPLEFCDIPPDEAPGHITPGLVRAALARTALPASQLQVEPPGGRTLVNFETNFFTVTPPLDVPLMLLGQPVDLHIVPSGFTWQFGDGGSSTTTEPGAPYPALDVTHSYLRKGSVAPRVDTTYAAQFRVGGGPWRDVPGSVTIEGTPVDLLVLTATPALVGYN